MGKLWDKTSSLLDKTSLGFTDVCHLELMLKRTNFGSHARSLMYSLMSSLMSSLVVTITVRAPWPRS